MTSRRESCGTSSPSRRPSASAAPPSAWASPSHTFPGRSGDWKASWASSFCSAPPGRSASPRQGRNCLPAPAAPSRPSMRPACAHSAPASASRGSSWRSSQAVTPPWRGKSSRTTTPARDFRGWRLSCLATTARPGCCGTAALTPPSSTPRSTRPAWTSSPCCANRASRPWLRRTPGQTPATQPGRPGRRGEAQLDRCRRAVGRLLGRAGRHLAPPGPAVKGASRPRHPPAPRDRRPRPGSRFPAVLHAAAVPPVRHRLPPGRRPHPGRHRDRLAGDIPLAGRRRAGALGGEDRGSPGCLIAFAGLISYLPDWMSIE
jgi:hypothetical protein